MPLDNDVRLAVEKNIDSILKDPEGFLKTFQMALWEMGIQPNLEAILAYITGLLFGIAGSFLRTWTTDLTLNFYASIQS